MSYKQIPIVGPFAGIVDNPPPPNGPLNGFDDIVNFFCRKGRLQSRPKLNSFTAPPDGKIVRLAVTFSDVNNSWHTLVLTDWNAYYLTAAGTYTHIGFPRTGTQMSPVTGMGVAPFVHTGAANAAALTDGTKAWTAHAFIGYYVVNVTDGSIGVITENTGTVITATLTGGTDNDWDVGDTYNIVSLYGTGLPFSYAAVNNRVYFSNGGNYVLYCDGSANLAVAGDVPGACRFMTVNAARILTGYLTEGPPNVAGSVVLPKRARWCKAGNTNDWTAFGSGFNEILETNDFLAGMATLGRSTFILRSNGITVATPTGVGISPFSFDQYSYSPQGVGCRYPYSLGIYDRFCVFVSTDDLYMLSLDGTLTPIARQCKRKIFNDLANASGDQVCGFVVPRLGLGFDFLSYWLSIPGVNVTWVWNAEENNWVRFTSTAGRLTCLANVAVA